MATFELTVLFNGKEHSFDGELVTFGYSYKIQMMVNDVAVTFEPDEERNYRAIVASEHRDKMNPQLLQAIAEALEAALK